MNSKQQHIKELLELFMEGKSSLKQESELSHYFATANDIPQQWKHYKQMFAFFDEGMHLETEKTNKKRHSILQPLWWVMTSAASIAITMILLTIGFNSNKSPNSTKQDENNFLIVKTDTVTSTNITKAKDTPERKEIKLASSPLMAKKERLTTVKKQAEIKYKTTIKQHIDSVELVQAQGQVELAQQEILADRLIVEEEREQMRIEQQNARAQFYQTQQSINNDNHNSQPQAIRVVFQ